MKSKVLALILLCGAASLGAKVNCLHWWATT